MSSQVLNVIRKRQRDGVKGTPCGVVGCREGFGQLAGKALLVRLDTMHTQILAVADTWEELLPKVEAGEIHAETCNGCGMPWGSELHTVGCLKSWAQALLWRTPYLRVDTCAAPDCHDVATRAGFCRYHEPEDKKRQRAAKFVTARKDR